MPWREKWRFFAERKSATVGLGTAIGLWLMVPVLGTATVPAAAIGGTLLALEELGVVPEEP